MSNFIPDFSYFFHPSPYGFNLRDLVIDYRQLAYSQGYSIYPDNQQYAVARVALWFVNFYRRFASNIVEATGYEIPVDANRSIYSIKVMIAGTGYELEELEKAMHEGLRGTQ